MPHKDLATRRAYMADYRARNALRLKELNQKWRASNPDWLHEYRQSHKEQRAKTKKESARRCAKHIREYLARYRSENAESLRQKRISEEGKIKSRKRAIRHYWNNREECLSKRAAYYAANPEKRERRNAIERQRGKENRTAINARVRARMKTDPEFRLRCTIRARISRALKNAKTFKCDKTRQLVGCDIPFLRRYIESQFQPGMTWGNHGLGHGKWNVDHRTPCASYDLTDPVQQRACFHYSNCQPMWAIANIQKGTKLPHEGGFVGSLDAGNAVLRSASSN